MSHLPALKSMMFAVFSGSVPLQRHAVTFAISEWFLYPVVAALSSTSAILIQATWVQLPAVSPGGSWVLTITQMLWQLSPRKHYSADCEGQQRFMITDQKAEKSIA